MENFFEFQNFVEKLNEEVDMLNFFLSLHFHKFT